MTYKLGIKPKQSSWLKVLLAIDLVLVAVLVVDVMFLGGKVCNLIVGG